MRIHKSTSMVVVGIAGVALLAGCVAPVATDGESSDKASQPSICGVTNWQDVERYDGTLATTVSFVNRRQSRVGNIKWASDLGSRYTNPGTVNGVRWCTGTMISADLMITAGHCFDVDEGGWTWPRVNGTAQPITSAQGATEMRVDFDYQLDANGVQKPFSTFAITQLVENRLGGLDYAIVRVANSPGTTYGQTALSKFPLATSHPITIIQHPSGLPKKVHAGPVTGFDGDYVLYADADTEGGSSGSGVLSNLIGAISAVHTNAGCTPSGGANRGVMISRIATASPIVRLLGLDGAKVAAVTGAML